jgi:cation transport ATPase
MSRAIQRYFPARDQSSYLVNVTTYPGLGVAANVPELGAHAYLGSPRFLSQNNCQASAALGEVIARNDGEQPLSCIGWSGEVKGIFLFADRLRPEASDALRQLREMGMDLAILTGDRTHRTHSIGDELAVTVHAELLPHDKLAMIERTGQRKGLVAMVGDGINDAPALVGADVGIAMGCGADVTRDVADICLLGNDLRRLGWSINLARRTVRTIRQNLFWACAYNSIGVGLAAAGWLNPIIAAAAMVGSSVFVISNSLRLAGETAADAPHEEGFVESENVDRRTRATGKDDRVVPTDPRVRSGDGSRSRPPLFSETDQAVTTSASCDADKAP